MRTEFKHRGRTIALLFVQCSVPERDSVMKSLTLRTRVAADGTVDLHLPCDWPPGNTEVLIVVQPVEATSRTAAVGRRVRSLGRRGSATAYLAGGGWGDGDRILLDAEQARMRFAVEEANKGIDWERLP